MVESSGQAQFVKHHNLLRHRIAFDQGETSLVYHSCLVPTPTEGCEDLVRDRTTVHARPCSATAHTRTAVKMARNIEFAGKLRPLSLEGMVQERHEQLKRETQVYEALRYLQGSVIPYFFGRWGEKNKYYVYEYVGKLVSKVVAVREREALFCFSPTHSFPT